METNAPGGQPSTKSYKHLQIALTAVICLAIGYFAGREHVKHEINSAVQSAFSPESAIGLRMESRANSEEAKATDAEMAYAKSSLSFTLTPPAPDERHGIIWLQGSLRNTGEKTLDTVRIKVTFLDKNGKAVGEKINPVLFANGREDERLKPNYSKDIAFACSGASPDWDMEHFKAEVHSVVFSK